MHELLNIVDENDQVIGQATRSEIHRTQRLHRAVHMLVSNTAGQVYLQKRAPTKDIHPNCWDSSAAGHVDSGEGYLDAAVRELSEELGIWVPAGEFSEFFSRTPCVNNGFEYQRIYSVRTDQTLTPCEREICDGKWLSLAEIDAWVADEAASDVTHDVTHDDRTLTPDLKIIWPIYRSTVTLINGLPPLSPL